jgi:hypothetical protein
MATTTIIERLYLIRKYGCQNRLVTRKTELSILDQLPPAVQAEVISAVMEREKNEGVQQ